MYSKHRMLENGEIEVIENNFNKFIKTIKPGEVFVTEYNKEKEARTLLQNNYLWGVVYPCFVPMSFGSDREAHQHFGEMFLERHDEIMSDDTEALSKIMRNARSKDGVFIQTLPVYKGREVVGVRLKIKWHKSTSKLSKREFNTYKNEIQRVGAEMGINVPDPNQIVAEKQ